MATATSYARGGHLRAAGWRVPRSRGALSGVLLVLLGIWGGLIPFVGPHFGYSYTPEVTWTMTWGRLWLEVVPAAAVVLGGLTTLGSTNRAAALWGSWLAALGGAWFLVGPSISQLWSHGVSQAGTPTGATTVSRVAQEIGFFYGLGVVVLFLAASALGRLSVVGIRDANAAIARQEAEEAAAEEAAAQQRAVVEQQQAEEARLAETREAEDAKQAEQTQRMRSAEQARLAASEATAERTAAKQAAEQPTGRHADTTATEAGEPGGTRGSLRSKLPTQFGRRKSATREESAELAASSGADDTK